jgi:UDP-glucose:(heptosyl)LPS alpha-1,3-glucosyltransferase
MVGSSFGTKGVDRAIRALASLTESLKQQTMLVIIGQGNSRPYLRQAQRMGVGERVKFLGPRNDVPRFLWGADLLLHPSYYENTGTVLVEALAAGLPVLASAVCGYGFHVVNADAGLLVPVPFNQSNLDALLEQALTSSKISRWRTNALTYAKLTDLYSLPLKAADIIEAAGRSKE